MLFAVNDSQSGTPEYIPPEYSDIPVLLDELVEYVNTTDDHPLIVAAIVHYQLVTIHPFEDGVRGSLSYLKAREKELLLFLLKNYPHEFTPIEVSKRIGVTNKTVISRLSVLAKNGFVEPVLANQRIRSYMLSEFAKDNEKTIKRLIS